MHHWHGLFRMLLHMLELGTAGYWLVFGIAFMESLAFIGWLFPGTILVIIAGGLAAQGFYDFSILWLSAALGALIGDVLSFEFGNHGKHFFAEHRWFKNHLLKGKEFFQRHGDKSVFLGRFVGPLRPVIPVIAGLSHMNRLRFYRADFTSGILWAGAHLGLGYLFGAAWQQAVRWGGRAGLALGVITVLLIVGGWIWKQLRTSGEVSIP